MLYLKSFTFNPFQENTYVVYTDEGSALIIDPGNSTPLEDAQLKSFIDEKKLRPERLLLTHGHIDHIMGNKFLHNTYGLLPEVHKADLFYVQRMPESAALYGVSCDPSPMPVNYLDEGKDIVLGKYIFNSFFTPGHSPGSLSFYNAGNKILLSGDVLFKGSIGRSDLTGGDHATLIASIKNKLLVLPDDVKVYSGHGPPTTIGDECINNPFLT
jgi:glyoxylase-like metal-dependent hydrolase (beta-lactamase superfamily II)